jgi:L-malate glycosyltransferase
MSSSTPQPSRPVIAVAGPIAPGALRAHLWEPARKLPQGLAGVPVAALVDELLKRGYRVIVTSLSPDVDQDVVFAGPNLRMHVGPYRLRRRARDAFRVERHAITRALLREKPDLVHAHWTYEFALGALASQIPSLLTIRDWAPTILGFDRDAYRVVRLLMHLTVLARGRHFSTVSPYIATAAARWGRDAVVVPNGLADSWFSEEPRSLRTTAPILVSVNAGFGERKNSKTLLEAFPLVRRQHPKARLMLVGSGHDLDGPAQRWAATKGLEEGVTFYGNLPYHSTMARIADADLLVHPSKEESFGMTLIEAMAQGTPVIGGIRSGAVPWVLGGGSAGVLSDVTSPPVLAASITAVLSDANRWQHLSSSGRDHVSSNFRLSLVVDRYVELYETVLSSQ